MTPQPGQRVKCFFRTSTVAEGIVEEWGKQGAVLKSLDGESLLIIHRPEEDIVLTKVLLPSEEVEETPAEAPQDLQQQFQQATAQENTVDVRAQSLVQLRILKSQQERKILASKLREHHLGQVQKVVYEQPGFRKGSSTE